MDYEKEYKDAVARMELCVRTGLKITPEYIFPELAESEDKRIRKALVKYFEERNNYRDEDETFNGIPFSDIIAYIEKQKDASKAIEAVDRIDKYIDEHLANAHDMKDSNPDKKYYRGWDDALGKMAGILQDVYSDEKQKEQKPTDRFEEAREKYQVEWSEEDEEKLKAICTYLRDYPRLAKLGDKLRFNEYCDFLKSLRPSWKPSNEQIGALYDCIEWEEERAEDVDFILKSLYNDLKKLM